LTPPGIVSIVGVGAAMILRGASSEIGNMLSRRNVLQAAGATVAMATVATAANKATPARGKPVPCLFTKPLQNRPFKDLPAVLSDLGINAVDLTCRKGGHVAPERVADDLPAAVELLKRAGIAVPMVTTEITDANKDHAEAIVKTVGELGIGFIKLGYFEYGDLHRMHERLAEVKARLTEIGALCGRHGVRAGFHNHSGLRVGAGMWDLWQLLQDLPAAQVGSYFDLRHATVEGSDGGWRIGLALLMPRIIMASVKDCIWQKDEKGVWRVKDMPLGQGAVRVEEGLRQLKDGGFSGPISLHVEYVSNMVPAGSDEDKRKLEAIRADWKTLHDLLARTGMTE
jgi:L-ribulose-5-phosphate 3-epimerase